VQQPPFFAGLSAILENFEPAPWKAWMKWQLISGAAAYLTEDFVNQNFEFYAKTLSGTPEIRVRWKRAISFVEGALGEAIGQIYVQRHFPEAAKVAMLELVDNLIEAYRISINELSWMSPETKAKALDKLAKFTPKIGYPDKWRDYSALTITRDDLFGNIGRITKFTRDIELAKIGKPVDKTEWLMTLRPLTLITTRSRTRLFSRPQFCSRRSSISTQISRQITAESAQLSDMKSAMALMTKDLNSMATEICWIGGRRPIAQNLRSARALSLHSLMRYFQKRRPIYTSTGPSQSVRTSETLVA
jgi:hypothetical protein